MLNLAQCWLHYLSLRSSSSSCFSRLVLSFPATLKISAPMSVGTGAIYRWSGKPRVREGRMIITESVPGELIRLQPEFFKPAAATNIAEFINMDKMIGDSSRRA